ncbi:hypothetical protein RDABS01_022513 [Bienertia sinuspersici]
MAATEELLEKYSRLNINEVESSTITIDDLGEEQEKERVSLVLVGKLLTERSYNVEEFKRTMTQAWIVTKWIIIRMIVSNLFVFQFFHWRDKEKVYEGRPWCFENNLLLLSEISGEEQPSEVKLTYSPLWVRIKNLSFNCRSDKEVRIIAERLGEVLEIENDDLGLECYRRVRINLDVTKPLCRTLSVKGRDGRVMEIKLAYERLPFFCFMCGIIGHSEKDCPNVDTNN